MPEAIKTKKSQSVDCSTDTIRAYLQEIGKIPLLTQEQEIVFGKQVRKLIILQDKKAAAETELKRQLTLTEWAVLVQMSEPEYPC